MLFGPDWLANLFLSFFLFGLVFTVASLLLGFVGMGGAHGAHGGSHVGGGHHIHVDLPGTQHDIHIQLGGHDGQAHADAEHIGGHDGPGVFNMPTIMAFITWFGGVGYILRQTLDLSGYIAGPLAVVSGVTGGAIMFLLLARVLWPMMSKPLDRRDFHLPGTLAKVVSSIRDGEGGVGEIVYAKNGARFTAGAKSEDGTAIHKGAEVVILRYEHGLAYVQDVADIRAQLADEEGMRHGLEQGKVAARLAAPTLEPFDETTADSRRAGAGVKREK